MNKKITLSILLSALVLFTTACASKGETNQQVDTFESYNRVIFKFNYRMDKYILKPAAKGYRAITNQFVRDRVRYALANLREPLSAVNNVLQGEPKSGGVSLSRFAINSTLGLVGMFDVADGWGLKRRPASFNQTFAKWCIKDGPFIMLPFFGPSTPRAAVGTAFEFAFDPVFWATYHDANIKDKVAYSYAALQAVSLREANLEFLDDLERNSVDFYATMRSAYLQNQSKFRCYNDKEGTQSYDFEFGDNTEDDAFDEMEAQ